jgi:hypothetical protein
VTDNEQKQQLSIAYVHAVAARAGFSCERPSVDDDSVDVVIGASGSVHDKALILSPRIELQLKATAQDELNNGHLAFPLPIKNYAALAGCPATPRRQQPLVRADRRTNDKPTMRLLALVVRKTRND